MKMDCKRIAQVVALEWLNQALRVCDCQRLGLQSLEGVTPSLDRKIFPWNHASCCGPFEAGLLD